MHENAKNINIQLAPIVTPQLGRVPAGPGANSVNCQLEKYDVGQLGRVPTGPSANSASCMFIFFAFSV